jgi:peptide chain release factor 2
MVNDHRTELKIGDVQRVMDGDIDPFIQAWLKREAATRSDGARAR